MNKKNEKLNQGKPALFLHKNRKMTTTVLYEDMVHELSTRPIEQEIFSREARNILVDITRDSTIIFASEVYGDTVSYLYGIHANGSVELYKFSPNSLHWYTHIPYPSKDILYSVISQSYKKWKKIAMY